MAERAPPPLPGGRASRRWLREGSRWAGATRPQARRTLAILALLLLASWAAMIAAGPTLMADGAQPTEQQVADADVTLYRTIVDATRQGTDYYRAAADAHRMAGFPLQPFVTMRMPALATVEALLPGAVVTGLLWLLAAGVVLAWGFRLAPALVGPVPLAVALALLAGGLIAYVQADLRFLHEIWAGLLIALSLALRRPGRWLEAVAFGFSAMLIRETAALYAALMLAAAWRDGERREAAAWLVAIALFAGALALHAHAVAQVVGPHDRASPGWGGFLGAGFFIRTIAVSTVLAVLPLWLAAPLVALALFGWASWRGPLATRMLATLVSYAALLALAARPDNFYWGLLVAPVLLVGLAFVPDAIADLARPALDRRRITVTRVAR